MNMFRHNVSYLQVGFRFGYCDYLYTYLAGFINKSWQSLAADSHFETGYNLYQFDNILM